MAGLSLDTRWGNTHFGGFLSDRYYTYYFLFEGGC